MRLKPERVEHLCRKIVAALQQDSRVKCLKPADEIDRAIRKIFLDDLQLEDDLMKEVDQIMEAHRSKIAGKNVDVQLLRRKIRDQLTRERKIVL